MGNRYRLGIGGDLIIAIDGKPVDGQDALRRALNQKRPGDTIVLTIFRGGSDHEGEGHAGLGPRSAVIGDSERILAGILQAFRNLSLGDGAFLDHAPVESR